MLTFLVAKLASFQAGCNYVLHSLALQDYLSGGSVSCEPQARAEGKYLRVEFAWLRCRDMLVGRHDSHQSRFIKKIRAWGHSIFSSLMVRKWIRLIVMSYSTTSSIHEQILLKPELYPWTRHLQVDDLIRSLLPWVTCGILREHSLQWNIDSSRVLLLRSRAIILIM